MGRLIVEQIVSADGYAADLDGGMSFVEVAGDADPNDEDQLAFLEGVDAILLGSNTYRMFADYWPAAEPTIEVVAEPINRLPKFVVSNTLQHAPWGDGEIDVLRGDGVTAATALRDRFGAVVVWGSLTLCDALLEAGVVDEVRLRVVPALIGAGRSFTPAGLGHRRLELDHAVANPAGQVTLAYRVR